MGSVLKAIRFADDQAIVASTMRLQRIMDAMNKTSEDYSMRINRKKTKVMRLSKY